MLQNIYVKRFLLAYAVSMSMVVSYFIIKSFFFEEKAIELKSFKTEKVSHKALLKKAEEENSAKPRFMLLPK